MTTFDSDRFVADCVALLDEVNPLSAISELVKRTIASPNKIQSAYPPPFDPDEEGVLFRSPDLTVNYAIFPETFTTRIHDHQLPAVIGVWAGSEDNFLYRQTSGGLCATGSVRVEVGQVLVLERDELHDVHIPAGRWSGSLHVYLGDLFALSRSTWADLRDEGVPFDGEQMERRWKEAAKASLLPTI